MGSNSLSHKYYWFQSECQEHHNQSNCEWPWKNPNAKVFDLFKCLQKFSQFVGCIFNSCEKEVEP